MINAEVVKGVSCQADRFQKVHDITCTAIKRDAAKISPTQARKGDKVCMRDYEIGEHWGVL